MAVSSGTRLGPYEILAPLGAGGMGEVYRARDTRLDRVVAVKILPPSLAQDEAARARFEREAKAVAALSDPHILAIYDVDVQGATAYAVMELLEGETLRDRITRAPLPPNKAVQIAREIAQGLSAAHEKGLVHRDIKPENVFVTTAGHVKILDFGLARQVDTVPAGQTSAPTTIQSTEPGTVLGTVGYMSPEQVRGEPADHRSDIFSLGSVLFESLSGRRPFERATAAETMTAILREDPPELVRADGPVSPGVDQVIRHCLEKQPAERFQSARDLAFALQASATGSSVSGMVAPVAAPVSPRSAGRWAAAAGAAALLAIGAVAGRYLWAGTPAVPSTQPIAFEQISEASGVQTEPTVSPDGKTVIYAQQSDGRSHLYLLRIGSRTPRALNPRPGDDDSEPAFSPEGERIAFRSERDGGGIFVMTATGESVRRLTDFGFHPSWSPDGSAIALAPAQFESPSDVGTSVRGLLVVNSTTGEKRELASELRAFQPAWSPHGQRLAFWGMRGDSGQRDIYTVASDAKAPQAPIAVTNDAALDWSPAWSPDGTFIYFSSRRGGTLNLWRVAIDEASGRAQGEPEPVTTPSNWSGYMSFSRDGSRMVFASLDWRSTLLKATVDLKSGTASTPVPIFRDSRVIRDHDLSPDGQWIAFLEAGQQENLMLVRTDGTEYRRLTDDAFRNRGPVWSPVDGQRLAFYSDRSGSYEAWTIRPDGSGLTRVTKTTSGGLNFPVWSPDGTHLAVSRIGERWWNILDAEPDKTPTPTPADSLPHPNDHSYFRALAWSPDSRKMLGGIMGLDGQARGYAVYEFASRRFSTVALRDGAWSLAWFPDSQHFLSRDRAGVWLASENEADPKLLVPVGGYLIGRSVAVARDGRSFTYTETGTEGQIWLARMKK